MARPTEQTGRGSNGYESRPSLAGVTFRCSLKDCRLPCTLGPRCRNTRRAHRRRTGPAGSPVDLAGSHTGCLPSVLGSAIAVLVAVVDGGAGIAGVFGPTEGTARLGSGRRRRGNVCSRAAGYFASAAGSSASGSSAARSAAARSSTAGGRCACTVHAARGGAAAIVSPPQPTANIARTEERLHRAGCYSLRYLYTEAIAFLRPGRRPVNRRTLSDAELRRIALRTSEPIG